MIISPKMTTEPPHLYVIIRSISVMNPQLAQLELDMVYVFDTSMGGE